MRRAYSALLGLLAIVLLGTGCATIRTRPLTWDVLPFSGDSDWLGPKGSPARIVGGDLILQGQRVRTDTPYEAPVVIECTVELEDRLAPDGFFGLEFVPIGSPRDTGPANFRRFRIIYRNAAAKSGHDALDMYAGDAASGQKILWGEEPFTVEARKPYAVRFEVLADQMRITINGTAYDLKDVKIPYKQFYIQLVGWQPTDRWHVRNFSIH